MLEQRCMRKIITSAQETKVLHLLRKLISVSSGYIVWSWRGNDCLTPCRDPFSVYLEKNAP